LHFSKEVLDCCKWKVHTSEALILVMQFSLRSRHFIPLRPKYSPQQSVLKLWSACWFEQHLNRWKLTSLGEIRSNHLCSTRKLSKIICWNRKLMNLEVVVVSNGWCYSKLHSYRLRDCYRYRPFWIHSLAAVSRGSTIVFMMSRLLCGPNVTLSPSARKVKGCVVQMEGTCCRMKVRRCSGTYMLWLKCIGFYWVPSVAINWLKQLERLARSEYFSGMLVVLYITLQEVAMAGNGLTGLMAAVEAEL
jgi:hypothetical protein